MGFPRQEYRSGLPFPSPGDLPDPGIEPALAGGFFATDHLGSPHKLFMRANALSASIDPTLCHPVDCSPPGSSVHGILQARTLEWVTTPSSRASSPPRDWTRISCVYCIAGGPYTAEPPAKPKLFTVLYKYEVITGVTLQLYYEMGLFSKGEKPSLPYFHH